MATTTNYGWTTPDDTALVKDGAAAIRTLGSSVDTTTKALNPSTTLGDIEYRSSTANTNTRLGIGSTGHVLTVAAGVPSWSALPASGGMTLLETLTLSGASVTSSSIVGTYKSLVVYLENVRIANDGEAFYCRFNSDSGTSYRTFTANAGGAANATGVFLVGDQDNGTSDGFGYFEIPNYASSTQRKYSFHYMQANDQTAPSTTIATRIGYTAWYNTNAITTLTFLAGAGNLTSGSIKIYGVA
jgi:hypothetical protein